MSVDGAQPASSSVTQYGSPTTGPAARHVSQSVSPSVPSLPKPFSRLAVYATMLPNSSVNSFCGAMAGAASGIVTCPLDVIKTKLQAQGGFRSRNSAQTAAVYRGMIGTARVIWNQDGIRGMYRGLGPMMLGYLPTWAVYMSVYEASRDYYNTKLENNWFSRIFASITAGACSTVVTNPIWVIKTRLQSQVSSRASEDAMTPWHYKNTLDAARKMYKTEGILAFYSGLAPAMLGLTHVAIQFPLYEYFKTKFTGLEMGENTADSNDTHYVGILAATFLSKICATSATYPHEVLRTRLQTQQRSLPAHSSEGVSYRGRMGEPLRRGPYSGGGSSSDGMINMPRYRGVIRTCKVMLQEEGWRAFYSGMGTNMVRAVPAAMTTMFTFEYLRTAIFKLKEEGNRVLISERE